MALPVSRLVRVVINLSPLAAARRSFGILMIAGDSDVISGKERFRSYDTIDGVVEDFGVNAPEYKASLLYFGQSPKPKSLMIGRWIRTASAGFNLGGILTASEAALANWSVISSGGFNIAVDGANQNLSGLDFSAQTNLNGVASVITGALSGAVCTWSGSEFQITSSTTGAGVKASGTISLDSNPSAGARAAGTITLSGQPSNGDTVTINSVVVTFVTGSPTGNQVQIGVSTAATSTALQAFLEGSANAGLAACVYNTLSLVTTVTARTYGTSGNAFTLAKSGTNIAVSGSGTLSGGVAADTLTVNGTALTFVAATPTGNQILVGATVAATSANLQAFLQASANSNINQATYSTVAGVTTATFKLVGTAGNSFTLVKSSSHISLSGATLSGGVVGSSVGYATAGSGTDISAMLKMTSSTAIALVGGYDAESPVACAAVFADMSAAWYGLTFAASVQPTDDQYMDVAAFIEAQDITRMFGVSVVDTSVLSALVTSDIASRMAAANYRQSLTQYSSSSPYSATSIFGRAFSVNFNANRSAITLMYKQEPGITAEDLTSTQANVLKAKRCNVFADYVNGTFILQYGVMSGSAYIDEIHGLDWFQDAVQNACYNLLYQSTTKIPQTDAGANQLTNAVGGVCDQAVANGLVAPGQWNADGFGELAQGQYLKTGYYIYTQPMALQSQSDRETRVAPPIQVAIKLAGAIQEVDVIVNVNR